MFRALTPLHYFLLSSLIYFSPYVLRSIESVERSLSLKINTDYGPQTGLVLALAIASILTAMVMYPRSVPDLTIRHYNHWEGKALTMALLAFGGYTALTPEIYLADKSEVLEATNRGHLLFYTTCSIGAVYSAWCGWSRERANLLLSFAGLLFILYIGHRSALAIALLAASYVVLRNRSVRQIPIRYIVFGSVAFVSLAIYKSIYVWMKAGLYDRALEDLMSAQLASLLVGLEPFLIFLHLDYVVSNDFSLECSNLWLIPVAIIPFSDLYIDAQSCTFTDQIHPVFFSQFSGGVGANIWAEFFALFGYAGIPLLVFVVSCVALLIEKVIRQIDSPVIKAALVISMMHFTFYIQRKELFGAFISAKRVIIAALIIYLLALLLKLVFAKRQSGLEGSRRLV
jgi:hypothetical protein